MKRVLRIALALTPIGVALLVVRALSGTDREGGREADPWAPAAPTIPDDVIPAAVPPTDIDMTASASPSGGSELRQEIIPPEPEAAVPDLEAPDLEAPDLEAPELGSPDLAAPDLDATIDLPVVSPAEPAASPEESAAPPPLPTAMTDPWVEPDGLDCPATHPIKAKLSSGIYQLPGMFAYARTRPDRCYADTDAADADGLTRAKR